MKVLVTHPGRQHSHQLVQALYEEELLREFWTGIPSSRTQGQGPLYSLIARMSPQPLLDLPAQYVKHNYLPPAARRLFRHLLSPPLQVVCNHIVLQWFDRWCAAQLPTDLDLVICYENSARRTFREAKKQGTTTILDAASFHHTWQDEFYDSVESEKVHQMIVRHKDEEIQLADHILTVSKLARESYIDAGVDPEHVTSVPMGVDLSDFSPGATETWADDASFRFIFAGHASRRKGVDVLLSASERVTENLQLEHRLQFAGGRDAALFTDTKAPFEHLGYLDRSALVEAFRQADCLVLPSRHDSFGRVIVEALSTGLPVIVSEHVGAKEALEEGESGWVVPAEDVDALAERMQWCIRHRSKIDEMKEAAVRSAQSYSWSSYRRRVVSVIKHLLFVHH